MRQAVGSARQTGSEITKHKVIHEIIKGEGWRVRKAVKHKDKMRVRRGR